MYRPLNDPNPQLMEHDDDDALERLDQQAGMREPEEEEPGEPAEGAQELDADGYMASLRSGRAGMLTTFEGRVAELIETTAQTMQHARQKLGIDRRYQEEQARYRCEEAPALTPEGEIDLGADNAHLHQGITLGLFTDACTGATPMLVDAVAGRGERPFVLEPVGRKREGGKQQEMLERVIDAELEAAGWRDSIESALRDLPRHGTAVLRQSWAVELDLEPDAEDYARLVEVVRREGLAIEHWPLLNVYVSHPNRPRAEDQATVIWNSEQTLAELERQERILDQNWRVTVDPTSGLPLFMPLPQYRGRFCNLEQLRRVGAQQSGADYSDNEVIAAGTLERDARGVDSVTGYEPLRVLELQGSFPLGKLMRMGLIDVEGLRYYGTELLDSNGEPLEGEAAARVADRLAWYITVVIDRNSSAPSGHVIECRPCPYRRRRTELLAARYIPDGLRFYGLSADAVAHDVGATADKVLNDLSAIVGNNANPCKIYSAGAFPDHEKNKVLFEDGAEVAAEGGKTPEEAVAYLLKPYDEHMDTLLRLLTETYTTRTMVSQSAKGAQAITSTGTFGEMREQIQQGERRLLDIGRSAARSLAIPSIRNLLLDLEWFTTPDELADRALRVAGEAGLDARAILATADDEQGRPTSLADCYLVNHPGMAAVPREVATAQLIQIAQAFATLPTLDVEAILRRAIIALGEDPDQFFIDQSAPATPSKELKMIMAGDRPEVNEAEDALGVHLPEHQMQLMALAAVRQTMNLAGQDTQTIDGLIEVLQTHLVETQELAEQQMAALQQAAMMAQLAAPQQDPGGGATATGGAAPAPQSGPQGGATAAAPAPPPRAAEMMNGQRAAAGMPGMEG